MKRLIPRDLTPSSAIIFVSLIVGSVLSILPILYMASTAFKPLSEILVYPPRFFVRQPTLVNFTELNYVLGKTITPLSRYIFNSVVVSGGTVFVSIFIATLAGYSLAKRNFPGKNLIFLIIVSGLMFSPHVTLIPRYMILKRFALLDSYWALLLPWISGSYGVFLMKQFIEPVPDELLEAAKIDGASQWQIFRRVIVPLCKPAWCTLSIFLFMWSWNDYLSPIIFVKSDAMYTLPVIIDRVNSVVSVDRLGASAAGSFLITVPVVIIFLVFQKYVVETMAHSGLKG